MRDGLWLQPCGSWVGWFLRGIWQSVYLEAEPAHAIADAFVQPSVRQGKLVVEVTLHPTTHPAACTVQARVMDGDALALDLGAQPAALAPDGPATVRFERPWPDARRWCPEDPHLYHLEVELQRAGQVVHGRRVRFGFREFWIEDNGFCLNGRPIRLFGDSWHYMGAAQQNPAYARTWFEMAQATGINAIRTHAMPYPPCYFDVADEMGMLIIDESALYGSHGTLGFHEPEFWPACRDHVRRMVRRDRNHPSIIFWSACNETVWKGGAAIFEGLLSLADTIGEVDSTRFVSFDENDCDLGGKARLHAGALRYAAALGPIMATRSPLCLT